MSMCVLVSKYVNTCVYSVCKHPHVWPDATYYKTGNISNRMILGCALGAGVMSQKMIWEYGAC